MKCFDPYFRPLTKIVLGPKEQDEKKKGGKKDIDGDIDPEGGPKDNQFN